MPCDFTVPQGMTPAQRKTQIEQAIDRLNKALAIGEIKVKVGPTGSIAFVGAWERNGVSDVCAYRKLVVMGSPALRQAVTRAETLAGRKVDPRAVAAGTHSHDGGSSWHKGH